VPIKASVTPSTRPLYSAISRNRPTPVTARPGPAVKAAIAAIPEDGWTPVKYPRAVWDEQQNRWISDAEVAEAKYTAFSSKEDKAITARLIVRGVRDLSTRAQAAAQGELFPAWRYHAVFTDSPFTTVQAEEQHRAVIEQVFADLTDGPLAHAPSVRFAANAAWLALAAIAHNLTRAAGTVASRFHARARGATIRAPDRCRRPDHQARPRPPHLAPARRLAPRARMDEPVPSGLRPRPASTGGLTRPDPVSAHKARAQRLPARSPREKARTSRRTRERKDKHARPQLQDRRHPAPAANAIT
jgi:hypothetical protein